MSPTAKELFASGDFSAAESKFLQAASASTDPTEIALQLSNAAQCALKLCQFKQAAEYASRAIRANAHNTKAHFRLATALASSPFPPHILDVARRCCDIAMANACAAALSKNDKLTLPGLDIISTFSHPVCLNAKHLLQSVIRSGATIVKNLQDLLECETDVAVLDSNTVTSTVPSVTVKHVVGLDCSSKICPRLFSPHALFIEGKAFSAWRLSFFGASQAMVCALGQVSLIDCTISNHSENGVLCAEPKSNVLLAFCNISHCIVGIEVREGARMRSTRCIIRHMARTGITGYAGAHSVVLEDTTIENVGIEGVQCLGPRAPMTIHPDSSLLGRPNLSSRTGANPSAIDVANVAAAAAQRDASAAKLHVSMLDCTVRRCGENDREPMIRSGVTVDQGAQVVMKGCLLQRCSMAGVFIKGGSDASIQHCRIEHGVQNDDGVRVDINYEGRVQVENCAFVGKLNRAIVDNVNERDVSVRTQFRAMTGIRSTPITKVENKLSIHARKVPSIAILRYKSDNFSEYLERAETPATSTCGLHTSSVDSVHTNSELKSSLAYCSSTVQIRYGAISYRRLGHQHVGIDYPIGNTYGRNVLEGMDLTEICDNEIRILLAACGDIRNVVETICGQKFLQRRITFILNDLSVSILARNIVLLELATRLWPKEGGVSSNAGSTWLHAWGSIALKNVDRAEMDAVIIDLAARKLPSWLYNISKDVLEALVKCWDSWVSCSRPLQDVRRERNAIEKLYDGRNTGNVFGLLAASAAGLPEQLSDIPELNGAELLKGRGVAVNPTLLSVGQHEYTMYESSIFRALNMKESINGSRSRLIKGACEMLERKGLCVATALNEKRVRITLIPGDLTTVLGDDINASVADMSNVMDYVSMPACMFTAARCLRRPGGVAFMHSMKTRNGVTGIAHMGTDTEMVCMRGASMRIVAGALGLRVAKEDDRFKTIWSESAVPVDGNWCFEAMERKSQDIAPLLHTIQPWYHWPMVLLSGIGIASSPSAVLCLQILAAADPSTKWATLVQKMCNASNMVKKFRLQLKAHAALVDKDESEDVVVASVALEDVDELMTAGCFRNFALRFASVDLNAVHCYDVFDRAQDRGVCDFLICRSDIEFLCKCSVELQAQHTSTRTVERVSRSVNLANLPAHSAIHVRIPTAQEKKALTSRLVL